MADRKSSGIQRNLKNPLLFGAGTNVTFEELTQTAQILPQPVKAPSNLLPTDVGEVDSFLGEDTPSVTSGSPAPPPQRSSPASSPPRPVDCPPPPSGSIGGLSRIFGATFPSQQSSTVPLPAAYSSETNSGQSEEGDQQLKQIPLGDFVPLYDPSSLPAPVLQPVSASRLPSRPYSPIRFPTDAPSSSAPGLNTQPPINSTPPTQRTTIPSNRELTSSTPFSHLARPPVGSSPSSLETDTSFSGGPPIFTTVSPHLANSHSNPFSASSATNSARPVATSITTSSSLGRISPNYSSGAATASSANPPIGSGPFRLVSSSPNISSPPPPQTVAPPPPVSSQAFPSESSSNLFASTADRSAVPPPPVSSYLGQTIPNLFPTVSHINNSPPVLSTQILSSPPSAGKVSPNPFSVSHILGSAPPTLGASPSSFFSPPSSGGNTSSNLISAPINSNIGPPILSTAPPPLFTPPPPACSAPPNLNSSSSTSVFSSTAPAIFSAVPPVLSAPPPVLSSAPPVRTIAPPFSGSSPAPSTVPPVHTLDPPNLTSVLPTLSSVPPHFNPALTDHSGSPATLSIPPPTIGSAVPPIATSSAPQQAFAAPPKGSGGAVSYRLSNLKRPTYAPPPDLNVNSRTPAMMTPPTAGQQQQHLQDHQQQQHTIQHHQQDQQQHAMHHQHRQSLAHPLSPPHFSSPPPPLHLERAASISLEATPPAPAAFPAAVQGMTYRPVYHHWFFRRSGINNNAMWEPFSMADSLNLEQAFTSGELNDDTIVATEGGRYDVEITQRQKVAVFWEEPPNEVRRCSWFMRHSTSSRYIPYDENIASLLEDEYKNASLRNEWNKRIELSDGEVIILHGPSAIAHHQRSSSPDPWGNPPTMQFKPRVVKRGLDEFDIPEGEPSQVDHLLLVVHGIGKVCDLRFRSLVEVVDDFRAVSLQLIQSHFKSGCERGVVGRVEVLPVEWHRALHTEAIDQRLSDITLPSIPKAREFTNETLLDILFYTSPVFCEKIVQAVGAELNRVYSLYLERNPGFKGGVFLGGHSLGSLILFDMLCHQRPSKHHHHLAQQTSVEDIISEDLPEQGHLGCLKTKAKLSRRMSYLTIGTAGAGQPYIIYPQLLFQPKAFFALGSPIGMFVTVRGIEALGEDFKFPTCPAFFNIFHPYDPVAYRIEALITPDMANVPAVLIPHHKGRKRMHLELKDTMAHVTAALKQKLLDSFRNTWNAVYQIAMFHRSDQAIEHEVEKVIENEMKVKESGSIDCNVISGASGGGGGGDETVGLDLKVGSLNGGRRIDYVLQEAPLETFNQYISAVRSHVVYWESEDTMLMILKELYQTMGISTDSQIPQPILPFDISSEDYADPGKAYAHYTESTTLSPVEEFTE